MSEYESGIGETYYVKVEVYGADQKAVLTVNPIGQFSPGGCEAFVYAKKDALTGLKEAGEIMDYFKKKICFENMEAACDLEDYSLGYVLDYCSKLEENEENDWWLPYFRRLEKKVSSFENDLKQMSEIRKIVVHQYHSAAGELCDFVDYTCCPEGEEEEELRSFFEENLADSDIDAIMECFEDGYFYGDFYDSDRVITADLPDQKVDEKLIITEIR